MKRYMLSFLVVLVLTAVAPADLFTDNFEGDLSLWVGKSGGSHHGTIVTDPLDSSNHVLTFTQTNQAGDIFSALGITLVPGQQYTISFRYLGDPDGGGIDGNLGGYVGISSGYPGTHFWYYGTGTVSGAADVLVDDGEWHTYSYTFTAPLSIGSTIHLMFEDFYAQGWGTNNIAGDVYFDDISLAPAPTAILLGILGLGVSGWKLRRFT